ncbi:interferon-related developmental regulator 1-like [Octopus vulgaris]|uniref:Interferon-related developmental regulator 1-like n=1 Tax=Octopus vulgaris TaxID=6645 RepID=A0AA36AXP8_OCTVU|nr:interferon-related developmental regulator 1-like [Octopus vulgaris]
MPKGKRKTGRRGAGSRPSSDDEIDTPDNQSVVSSISDDGYFHPIAEEGHDADGEVDESTVQQNFEDNLRECIDGLMEKSQQTRINCLNNLIKALSTKYICDFLLNVKFTIVESLLRLLKKGKCEEQVLAAHCVGQLFVQLGEDSKDLFEDVRETLMHLLNDHASSVKARQKCADTLSICSFVACRDVLMMRKIMGSLEQVFKESYLKNQKANTNQNDPFSSLYSSALSAWTLLLSIAPNSYIAEMVDSHLGNVISMLESPDVELRIVAGETIALMYELQRGIDQDFEGDDIVSLCEMLKQLATDGSKHRAKKDRRQQRSTFRGILKFIEDLESPADMIKFGPECLYLDSWARKKQYDSFCQVLGSGTPQHFQANYLLRDVFDLGAPLLELDGFNLRPKKMTKGERNYYNISVEKKRTKARAKNRDKRSVTVSCY